MIDLDRLPFSPLERDIDLLLIELFHCVPEMTSWFAGRAGVSNAKFVSATHSVYRKIGETDVLLIVRSGEDRVAIMIEDKIGAAMQPEQAERYDLRGQDMVEQGEVEAWRTVLCAPEAYLNGVAADALWGSRVSFEEIATWLDETHDTAFASWQALLLRKAAERSRRANRAENGSIEDSKLIALIEDYRTYAAREFPQFSISSQSGSDKTIYIKARNLRPGVRLKHAFFKGEVTLIFEAKHVEAAMSKVVPILPLGISVVKHGSELHLRGSVEPIDPECALSEQEDLVRIALERLLTLVPFGELIS